jgi:hypothetical protein
VLLENLWKIVYDVSELMEPTEIFFQRLIMFMIDLLDFMELLNCI